MLEAGHKAIRLIISGRVQGVWYRGWTVQAATALELNGWVRNRADGTVEALIVGPERDVDALVKQCWEGPRLSRVDTIDLIGAIGITPKGFIQKPSVDIEQRRT